MVKQLLRNRPWAVGLMLTILTAVAVGCTAARPAPTPTPLPTARLVRLTATPTFTPSPSPSPTTPCFAVEIDGPAEVQAQALVGETVTAQWRLVNVGACPWPGPLALAMQPDSAFPGRLATGPEEIAPGEAIDIAVSITAPETPGEYVGRWALRTAQGELLPVDLRLRLQAVPPTPTPTATPGPPLFVYRQVDVTPGDSINFDDGGAEVAYGYNGPNDQGLGHVGDHVFFKPIYYWPPDFADCYNASYGLKNALLNPQNQVGMAFCYTTNEKRVGALRIDGYYIDNRGTPHLVVTYMTWAAIRK